ncbi:cilia- and flagella-associated protein 61-like [Schistocerca gregaria]|uniref:cilia- and flagella-associated protein 61-like n=1 Tax=Schistocerca gregaria TaxID=7010 RepID=UPI00211DB396|nr:cilia- and flagella-associated protein 61-like [Schistocerca gregaria]
MNSEPEVREASASDLREARPLAAAVGRTDVLRSMAKDPQLTGYVLLCGGVIVGVAVLRSQFDISDLTERYDLRPVCGNSAESGRHALLRLLAVNPPFASWERFFLDELLRFSNTICLHYLLLADRRCGVTALRELTPVLPRRMIQYWLPSLPCGRPRGHLLRVAPPAALLVASSSLAAPRTDVNCRIIVVGASQAGLGFIQRLIYQERKSIVINGQCVVRYDYLYLFCGRQFQKPEVHDRLKYVYNAEECHSLILYKKSPQGPAEYPDNVFVVNTEKEAAHSLKTLHRLIGDQKKYNVIVFGHSINSFCCMTALLEYGIPGPCITFIESFPDHMTGSTNTIFNNPEIDNTVMSNLRSEGIRVHSGFYFHSWVLSETEPRVLSATFVSMTKTISLDCVAFFYYSPKTISRTTYKALRRASLPFDGGVLVDEHFRTPDPYVLAAGPVTRFSPQLCTLPMHRYDSEEIGERVADELLVRLQNEFGTGGVVEEPEKRVGQQWYRPMVVYCKLPGGAYYLRVRQPGIDVPLEAQKAHCPEDDTIFITGSCTKPQGYFRIHFDRCDIVRKITCYSQNKIDADNLICLYGKHESLLNNLKFRYEQGEISDFFEYFREPWCYAIYHDRFSELQAENLKIISSGKGHPGETIIDEIGAYLKETSWKKMPDGKRAELVSRFWTSPLRRDVEGRMLAFLRQNRDALPMYADPATFRSE